MNLLHPINDSGSVVRAVCIPGVRDGGRRARLESDDSMLAAEERNFEEAIATGRLRDLSPATFSSTVRDDMVWLYETRIVSHDSGRSFYDKIMHLARDTCPLCGIARPRTLDHSFPKATFPRLAVDPRNLVPACRDCNFSRNVGTGSITISPYFDWWLEDSVWLSARVVDATYPGDLEFYPTRDERWSEAEWISVEAFFKEADLDARYSLLAADEYTPLATEASLRFESSLESAPIFEERYKSSLSVRGINAWQTAAYKAWMSM